MKKNVTKKVVYSAVFVALGMLLPFLTGQIPKIGAMLLPMHLPVFLAGLILGWQYGLAVGVITPILRSFVFGMPPLFPTATAMCVELAVYGAIAGLIYFRLKPKVLSVYFALIPSMIIGRGVLGLINILLYSFTESPYTFAYFVSSAFVNAIPGIILQLVLIPVIMLVLMRAKLIPYFSSKKAADLEEPSKENDSEENGQNK